MMKIGFRPTTEEYKNLGDWEAQIIGLPQARCYAKSAPEAVGKLILSLGRENGMGDGLEICNPSEIQDQKSPKF